MPILSHLVAELRVSHAERELETELALDVPVDCDPGRLSLLLSNLLANALTYGAPDKPVLVRASASGGELELSVSNQGDPIPPPALERLFEPFERGAVRPNQQGLGLGLFIAAQVAAAHGGTLSASSTLEETASLFGCRSSTASGHGCRCR